MRGFVRSLTPAQWSAPSNAAGWSIAAMGVHSGSTAHNMYTPGGIRTARQPSLEVVNEGPVQLRRSWSHETVVARTPAARITAQAVTFPDWGTQRSAWRDANIEITARYLDGVNISMASTSSKTGPSGAEPG